MEKISYDIQGLLSLVEKETKLDYLFFWGHKESQSGNVTKSCFSQWWQSPFSVHDTLYDTAEHWMMAKKAELFGDIEMRGKILNAPTPADAKKLGRKVRNFDPIIWDENCSKIVVDGNIHKFSQNSKLKDFLLSTGSRVLVEASPLDKIWGIGMSEKDEHVSDPRLWKGKNLLGFALMQVRDKLRNDEE